MRNWFRISPPIFLIILALTLIAGASLPSVTTLPATNVDSHSAYLNGNLTNAGGTYGPILLRQHKEMNCGATLVCTISFDIPTLSLATIVLSGQSDTAGQEYCAAPTDSGSNTWPRFWALVDANSHGGMSWIKNASSVSSITVTRCSGDFLKSINVFEFSRSFVLTPAMTQLNSASTGYGISLASVHRLTVAVISTNTANLGTNCVTNTAKRGTYLGKIQFPGTAVNICAHSIYNVSGTDNSVSNNDAAFLDGVAIDLVSLTPYLLRCGFQYGTDPALAGANNFTADNTTTAKKFTHVVLGLNDSTTYYFRAWCINGDGYSAGSILSFTTPAEFFVQATNWGWVLVFFALITLGILGSIEIRNKRRGK